ncbi:hypothetical protein AB205_0036050 [Aquarana catesbeiana]|uniref:Uncharacterized protein n=1 Tax=Aquarana catesbeiana TaxID=8400 RepID=A0A2G9QDN9_AQUCT|nr:hypothetical protein AB205_0036050 [Aquarana catesbeiana]
MPMKTMCIYFFLIYYINILVLLCYLQHLNLLQQTDAESLVNKVNGINNIGRADSCDLLNTALIEVMLILLASLFSHGTLPFK